MKRRIFSIFFALVLVLSMSLVMAAPVAADVSSPRVTLSTAGPEAGAIYTIKFIPTVALTTADDDTITIVFPEDTDITDITADGGDDDVKVDNVNRASVTVGQRLTITLGDDQAAGTDIPVIVGTTHNVTNPLAGDHTLQVYTSQEPTAVTSQPYTIWTAASNALILDTVVLDPSSAYAGATTAYTIPVKTGSESAYLPYGSTLTFQFPDGTGVSGVTGATFDGATASFAVSGQEVTVTLLAPKFLGSTSFKDVVISGVVNPDLADTGYILKVKSNVETTWVEEAFDIEIGTTIVKLGFSVKPSVIAPDEVPAQVFTVEAQDQGGNLVDSSATVVPSSTSLTGEFWDTAACDNVEITAAGIALTTGDIDFYYKDATAGDYIITVTELVPSTPPWTDATTPLTVSEQLEVGLYHGTTPVAYYHTITDAITDAVPGDTIKVGPGTYTEGSAITVDVANLTLESTGTAAETIIDATGGGIVITASDVTVNGFTVENVQNDSKAIEVTGDDAIVKNNVITLDDPDEGWAWGIWIGPGGVAGATVEYNELAQEVTIMVVTSSNVVLSDNVFGGGINLDDSTDIDIINNDILDVNYVGICFQSAGAFSDILIEDNTISGTTQTDELTEGIGIVFRSNVTTVTNLQIIGNDIINNLGPGIVIPSNVTLAGINVIQYNDISGNVGYGIRNLTSANVDATYNWWGDVTGPTYTALTGAAVTISNPNGTGDAISDQVIYYPWLHKPQAECVIASFPALTVDLSVGWNTLSTPAKLISTADTVDKLVPAGLSNAYWYDAFNEDGPIWRSAVTHQLLPCDAVYIKMLSTQTVLFQVDGAATYVPSKDLAAGWNLIGLASLIDMKDESAIASVFGSYAQLVSPSMNTAPWVYITGEGESAEDVVLVGEGYWIFMKSEATLGGFVLCPIVPQY